MSLEASRVCAVDVEGKIVRVEKVSRGPIALITLTNHLFSCAQLIETPRKRTIVCAGGDQVVGDRALWERLSAAAARVWRSGARGRMSRQRKRDVGLRLLRGEDLETASRSLK